MIDVCRVFATVLGSRTVAAKKVSARPAPQLQHVCPVDRTRHDQAQKHEVHLTRVTACIETSRTSMLKKAALEHQRPGDITNFRKVVALMRDDNVDLYDEESRDSL